MAGAIRICSHNIDGFGSCDIMADGVCVQGPCHAEELVEYAPVVRGRWEEADWVELDGGGNELIRTPNAALRCSVCCNCFKKELLWKEAFCPNCGAKMDGGDPDGR